MVVTFHLPKTNIKIKRKEITAANIKSLMPCTFDRLKEVFLTGISQEDKRYDKLLDRLTRLWINLQMKKNK